MPGGMCWQALAPTSPYYSGEALTTSNNTIWLGANSPGIFGQCLLLLSSRPKYHQQALSTIKERTSNFLTVYER